MNLLLHSPKLSEVKKTYNKNNFFQLIPFSSSVIDDIFPAISVHSLTDFALLVSFFWGGGRCQRSRKLLCICLVNRTPKLELKIKIVTQI